MTAPTSPGGINVGYTGHVTASMRVAGFGDSTITAAHSRNAAQVCGFLLRAPVLAARMGGFAACRLISSAVVPVRQPVRAASRLATGCGFHKTTTGTTA